MSQIEWTDQTWNPVTGCTQISNGCDNCYALRMSNRLRAMGQPNYQNGFELTLQPHAMQKPLTWRKPRRVFVNSMSDLFHKNVPESFINEVMDVCREAHWHQFQILTKRSQRLARIGATIQWPPNVWMGVSVESAIYEYRIDHLRDVPVETRFVSFEPLIGPIERVNLKGIHWAIVGGESGPGSRPSHPDWFRKIRSSCERHGTAFFFKQYGDFAPADQHPERQPTLRLSRSGSLVDAGTKKHRSDALLVRVGKGRAGRLLDGMTWDEYPESS